ncbi:acyl-CoA dehydrogenase family protein [Amphiplicatus metriothermophilus]|uniref:Acyl-CoA dehydrogenase n=1 Tax=Amphiplicatus metriothermophilus TaxID=1519374 RepID=A0A239PSK6_9PROT|nr:acyl-CoA dehydrogenase family protein [Amphiplicatus metriothermophilus]MBB5519202.1 acyl-CoA dehydrogenase [Amphiplicatus metriothermophilus]SNT73271.1 acyl-CoA dehydrogenase [Amphiplicatus metriothermophilus]
MVRPLDFDSTRLPSPHTGESHEAWRRTVRAFVDREIAPYVNEWDERGEFPRALHRKAAEIGLIGLGYPEDYGGTSDGVDVFHSLIASEELARAGAGGLIAGLMTHGIGLPPILALGPEALKRRIAPPVLAGEKLIALCVTEPSGGSDVARLKTRAVRRGDVYIVNGEKTYITTGMRADYLTVAVRTGGDGAGGLSFLLIEADRKGVSRAPLPKMGWWMSDTASIRFDDVEVPAENLIGAENQGFAGIVANFNMERLSMAAQAIAFARVCLADAADWALARETFGKPLAKHQVIRHKLAEMLRSVLAAQAFLDHCAWRVKNGVTPVAALALLKTQASRTMEFCAREAMQILGGAGFIRGCRVERIYREVRVMAIGGGSEEIMLDLAARQSGL